jgi:hypothetical protein
MYQIKTGHSLSGPFFLLGIKPEFASAGKNPMGGVYL